MIAVATQPTNPLPRLPDEIRAGLRASIEKFGVLVPIVVDQTGRILDGRHRSEIADELGRECPRHEVRVNQDTNLGELIAEINDQRRQRLTAEQRKQMTAALREAGWSIRRIGEETGVSKSQAAKDVAALAEVSTGGHVEGRDGKTYPAKKRKSVTKAGTSSRNGNGRKLSIKDTKRVEGAIEAAGADGLSVHELAVRLNLLDGDALRGTLGEFREHHDDVTENAGRFYYKPKVRPIHRDRDAGVDQNGSAAKTESKPFDPGPYPYADLDTTTYLSVPWTPEMWGAQADELPDHTPAERAINDLHFVDLDEDVFKRLEEALSAEPSCAEIIERVRQLRVRAEDFAEELLRFRGSVRMKFHPKRLDEMKRESPGSYNMFDLDAEFLAALEKQTARRGERGVDEGEAA